MAITAQQVKELRDKTGAGMMDCKKALTESHGDFTKAIEILRKKGASVAAKRAERSANEGLILTELVNDNAAGLMLEVNCETDFVAKSDDFVNFANLSLKLLKEKNPANVDELLALDTDGKKLKDELQDLLGKIGEKIEISRFVKETSENGVVVDYVHQGSKLGVLVRSDNVTEGKDDFSALIKDIAMQVAAMKPLYVSREEVPSDVIEKEIEIYKELAKKEGKPEQVLDKIAQGRLNKFYEEACLLEQAFVKDNTKKVADLIAEFNKANSSNAKLKLFHRFHVSDENK